MGNKYQFQAIAVLSVESDSVSFSVISSKDGRMLANCVTRLSLIKLCPYRKAGNTGVYNELTDSDEAATTVTSSAQNEPVYVEQDPDSIWDAVERMVSNGIDQICRDCMPVTSLKSVGVVAETGTLLAWDAATGESLHNAIHWTDPRMANGGTGAAAEWLLQWSPKVQCAEDNCRFGTLDAWLLWRLTGGTMYATDATCASYTGLLDLATLSWNAKACETRGLSGQCWPTVHWSSNHPVILQVGRLLGLSVNAVMARPSAALFAQRCRYRGQAVVTLTHSTAMALGSVNSHHPPVRTTDGPLPVIGYGGPGFSEPVYGLLTVSKAMAVMYWLKTNMSLVSSVEECMNAYAMDRPSGQQAYVVPALDGLPWPPHNSPNARMALCGITENMSRMHIITAAVDSMCYSVADMMRCIASGAAIKSMDTVYVDGTFSAYSTMLQKIADVSGSQVIKARDDMAVHGVARMSAFVTNMHFDDFHVTTIYRPTSTSDDRLKWAKQWGKAVYSSYDWVKVADHRAQNDVISRVQPPKKSMSAYVSNILREVCSYFASLYRHVMVEMPLMLS